MTERFSLKDALFNEPKVRQLAGEIAAVYPAFASDAFVLESVGKFPELELKARIAWLTECLAAHLPGGYRESLEIILAALPPELDPTRSDDDFGDFIHAPYGDFVARFGCTSEHLTASLEALHTITRRFSAEGAIRPFLNAYPAETLRTLRIWCDDPNYHVRRLCSEGTRPLLPWNMRLTIPYAAPVPLLDRLHADPTRYVTRSVANHINDVAKLDSGMAVDAVSRWTQAGLQAPAELRFMARHSLRTLIKQGHPGALELVGISTDAPIVVLDFRLDHEVSIGDAVSFSFALEADDDVAALVDYVITFAGPGRKPRGRKVFKLKQAQLVAGQRMPIAKAHPMRGGMTTRTLYLGEHVLEIQVNGVIRARGTFLLH